MSDYTEPEMELRISYYESQGIHTETRYNDDNDTYEVYIYDDLHKVWVVG